MEQFLPLEIFRKNKENAFRGIPEVFLFFFYRNYPNITLPLAKSHQYIMLLDDSTRFVAAEFEKER